MKRIIIVGALAASISSAMAAANAPPPAPMPPHRMDSEATPDPAPTPTASPETSSAPTPAKPPGFNGPATPPPSPPAPEMQIADVIKKAQRDSSNIATCRTREKWQWELVRPGIIILQGTSYLVSDRQDAPTPGFAIARSLVGGEVRSTLREAQKRAFEMASDDCDMGVAP